MNDVYNFHIRITQTEDVCVVSMETTGFSHIQGDSRRHPDDENNPVIGQCVAFSRIFGKLQEHYDEIVKVLQKPPEEEEAEPPIDMAEAVWLKQFQVPDQEMLGNDRRIDNDE